MMSRRLELRKVLGRGEIVDRVAKRLGCGRIESKRLLDSVLGFITKHLRGRRRVRLTPFGIFIPKLRRLPAAPPRAAGNHQPAGNRGKRSGREMVVFRSGKDLERRRRS